MSVKRTERGWAGHFCCADRCKFRRNTLLEYKDAAVVVSTVGLMRNVKDDGFEKIGFNRCFETMVFHTDKTDTRYKDIDATREISLNGEWAIDEFDADDLANDMHEDAVNEITERLLSGNIKEDK